jgi:simple sugar transport system ATP-binding protein
MGTLSGGNQQKAIIAREIDKGSNLLLSIQTVRGLDVGAVEFAHNKIIEERDKGKAVLMISFELDEVMDVSDRILVMYEGKIVKNVLAKDIDVEELGLYMAGVKQDSLPPEKENLEVSKDE